MFEEVADWVLAVVGDTYTPARGQWVESTLTADKYYLVVKGAGGLSPMVDVRKPKFSIILIGRRDKREDSGKILQDMELLMKASLGDSKPCGSASLKAMGEPIGPGFTTENRAWSQVDFEVLI